MSGGVAYIYDVKNVFAERCNTEMVDLDPCDEQDATALHDMLTKHYDYTKSGVANYILNDFENAMKNFIKVFPKDYKNALALKHSTAQKEMK
jgi:glutamate synthase (NADPH) large chain